MKVLSIDIGIKNLAYVILDHSNDTVHIIKWDTINLCNIIPNCYNCNKQAKFSKKNIFYCKQHTKNTEYKIPPINVKTLSKKTMKDLITIASEYNIPCNKSTGKNNLIKLIGDHLNNTCFEIIETFNANNVNLIDLGINLKTELNKLFSIIDISTIDIILLENQIGPIAIRMKTLQGMIAQYFIDIGNYNIEFISATNKLKLFLTSKNTTYSERKRLSIQYTQEFLSKKNMIDNLEFFNKHSKKDDLADSLLQGIYYISCFNNLKIN